jgi:hypothetical protein
MPDVGTRRLVLIVDGTNYTDSVSTAAIRSAESDSDFISFADAAAGGARDYVLGMTLKQNTSADSLWDLIWAQPGEDLDFELWPNGMPEGGVPTVNQPLFEGTATVTDPDGDLLGGEANPSNTARMTTEVEWPCTAKPTRVTSGD